MRRRLRPEIRGLSDIAEINPCGDVVRVQSDSLSECFRCFVLAVQIDEGGPVPGGLGCVREQFLSFSLLLVLNRPENPLRKRRLAALESGDRISDLLTRHFVRRLVDKRFNCFDDAAGSAGTALSISTRVRIHQIENLAGSLGVKMAEMVDNVTRRHLSTAAFEAAFPERLHDEFCKRHKRDEDRKNCRSDESKLAARSALGGLDAGGLQPRPPVQPNATKETGDLRIGSHSI